MGWRRQGAAVAGRQGPVLVVDLANPESPKIVATLPLKNSVVGPPVNLDIDPTGLGRAGGGFSRCREGRRQA